MGEEIKRKIDVSIPAVYRKVMEGLVDGELYKSYAEIIREAVYDLIERHWKMWMKFGCDIRPCFRLEDAKVAKVPGVKKRIRSQKRKPNPKKVREAWLGVGKEESVRVMQLRRMGIEIPKGWHEAKGKENPRKKYAYFCEKCQEVRKHTVVARERPNQYGKVMLLCGGGCKSHPIIEGQLLEVWTDDY